MKRPQVRTLMQHGQSTPEKGDALLRGYCGLGLFCQTPIDGDLTDNGSHIIKRQVLSLSNDGSYIKLGESTNII